MEQSKQALTRHRNKSNGRRKGERIHKHVSMDKWKFLCTTLHDFIPSNYNIKKLSLAEKFNLMNEDHKLLFKKQARGLVREIFGTQEPVFRLRLVHKYLALSGGLILPTYDVSYTQVHDNGSLSAIFDEYQWGKGHLQYTPLYATTLGARTNVGVGVIDYDDQPVFTNTDQALGYDTYKLFPISPIEYHPTVWEFQPQGIPDKSWINSDNNNTVCWWAAVAEMQGTPPYGTNYFGVITGEVEVRFRQVH